MFSLQFNLQSRSENLSRTQNFQDLEKSACTRDHKANKARGEPKELWTNIFALGPVQDPREPYLRPRRAINRFTAPYRAGLVSTREVNNRSSCSADPEHRGFFQG